MSAWRTGKVQWFNEKSGQGMVADSKDGLLYFVHYSSIQSDKNFKSLKKGQKVKYQLYENLYSKRIDKVVAF